VSLLAGFAVFILLVAYTWTESRLRELYEKGLR
jgi:hypothetical protein